MKQITLKRKKAFGSFFLLNCLTLLFAFSLPAFAQTKAVSGNIQDESGQALAGVSVTVKGGTTGVASDANGNFSIDVIGDNAVLVFSHTGFQLKEIPVGNKSNLNVTLAASGSELGEVVVVGYGTQKKVSMTSAVSEIKGAELVRRPVSSVQQALQGQLPGLTILDHGGSPGNSDMVIRVRGITTIGTNAPLVIVDGMEQPLADLNPNDIESISILKDASSTAIYGSRAANGVILVTTKRAKKGKVTVTYNGLFSLQEAVSKPQHMDIESYLRLQNLARENVGSAPIYTEDQIKEYVNPADRLKLPLPFTWYETMFHTAPHISNAVSVSGGSGDIRARLSVRYQDQEGIIPNSDSKITDVRLNTDYAVSPKINIATDINYRNKSILTPVDEHNVFLRMMQNSIWTIPKFPDGTYGIGPQGNNPLLFAEMGGTSKTAIDYLTGNIKGDWEILKGLTFTTQFGARITFTGIKDFSNSYEIRDYFNPSIIKKTVSPNRLTEVRNYLREFTLNNLLNYSAGFGGHSINILAGYSQIGNRVSQLSASRQDFYNNDIQSIGQGTNDATKDNGGGESKWGLRSYFGRLNYAYNDKYLFEANGRYDGSSRFLGDNRYSFFPSFSAGWRISKEGFWDGLGNSINEFKLRGSWGKTGNQAVDLYSYFSTLNLLTYSFSDNPVQGYAQLKMANEDLTWETTTQTDIGIDAQLLNNRVSISVDYYKKRTNGILLLLPVPGTLGLQAAPQNAGIVDNIGWEFTLGTHNTIGQFGINANFNFSINDNEVVDLAGTGPYITGSDIDPRYITGEGYPINAFWGYKTDGLFQSEDEASKYPEFMRPAKPGDVKVLDLNGDGKVNADDMTYIGNSFPKYTFGASLNFTYKSFALNMLWQGAAKVGVRLARAMAEAGNYEGFTPDIYTNNFWTPEHRDARFPRPTKKDLRNQASTDRMVLDGSYLRLKNLQLVYQIPSSLTKKAWISRMSVFASTTNLLTFSELNEWHLDPESLSGWQDYYPQTAFYSFGVNLQF